MRMGIAVARRGLTLEEFLELPETKPALEYFDGVVTQKVSPKGPHAWLQPKVWELFSRIAEPLKLGLAFTELRTIFARGAPVPDVTYYRWERIPRKANGEIADDFGVPPDIAIEIASPGQTRDELVERCRWYVENGVQISLLVLPSRQEVHDFRPGGAHRVLRGADLIDVTAVVPAPPLVVQQLFDLLNPG